MVCTILKYFLSLHAMLFCNTHHPQISVPADRCSRFMNHGTPSCKALLLSFLVSFSLVSWSFKHSG